MNDQEGKKKALEAALGSIEKQFGTGAIMKMGQSDHLKVDAISTGSLGLDIALGVGGVPRGRVIEIFGPESSGKTTLALNIVANAQRKGGIAAFIDAEHAFDPEYAKKIGVDVENLLISQPDTGEQALEIAETLIRSNALDVVVIDSVAALVPRSEIEGEMGESSMGVQARLMSQAMRKITGALSRSKTAAIFINQLRMKIGVMFGNPETTTGGMALKFYSSVRMDIRRIQQLKRGEDIVGNHVRVKVVKNKVAAPFRQAEFDIMYNEGISLSGEIIDMGVLYGVVEKNGAWFTLPARDGKEPEKLGQGKEAARTVIKKDKKLQERLQKEILKAVKEKQERDNEE